jgi:hypothetical protein
MLPGIPLTRIMPVERIAESFLAKKFLKESVNQESDAYCVFCCNPADYFVSVCQGCFDELVPDDPLNPEAKLIQANGVEILEEKDLNSLAEKLAA